MSGDDAAEQEIVHLVKHVEDYRELVEALTEENRQLRLAANTFGRLAERLNEELRRVKARTRHGESG